MKIVNISCTTVAFALLCGCSAASPSADKNANANNNVSNSTSYRSDSAADLLAPKAEPSKKGLMQNAYDRWEKEEWEPNTAPEPAGDSAEPRSVSKQSSVREEAHAQEKPPVSKDTSLNEASPARQENPVSETPTVQAPGDGGETAALSDGQKPATPKKRNASNPATLQYYFDKWGNYLEAKERQSTGPSKVEQMESMPAIGVPDKP